MTLEQPEVVPFRLTQNLVDGFGASGMEGVYRKSCEVTLQVSVLPTDSMAHVACLYTIAGSFQFLSKPCQPHLRTLLALLVACGGLAD